MKLTIFAVLALLALVAAAGPVSRFEAPVASPEESPEEILEESASPEPEEEAATCFPASATVHAGHGDVPMSELAAGHSVRVSETDSSDVFLFSHRTFVGMRDFVRIESDAGHSVSMTSAHYVYANDKLVAAGSVKVGDRLRTLDGPAKVLSVKTVRDMGLVAPHTMHGDIVVNRVVASTYTTAVHPAVAHYALAPARALVRMGLSKEPLGALLYDGAGRSAAYAPKGPQVY